MRKRLFAHSLLEKNLCLTGEGHRILFINVEFCMCMENMN